MIFEAHMEASSMLGRPTTKNKAACYCYSIINRSGEIADSRVYRGIDTATLVAVIIFTEQCHILLCAWLPKVRYLSKELLPASSAIQSLPARRINKDTTIIINNIIITISYCTRCNLQMTDHYRQLSRIAHNHICDLGLVLKETKQDCNIKIHVKQLKIVLCQHEIKFIDSCTYMCVQLSYR